MSMRFECRNWWWRRRNCVGRFCLNKNISTWTSSNWDKVFPRLPTRIYRAVDFFISQRRLVHSIPLFDDTNHIFLIVHMLNQIPEVPHQRVVPFAFAYAVLDIGPVESLSRASAVNVPAMRRGTGEGGIRSISCRFPLCENSRLAKVEFWDALPERTNKAMCLSVCLLKCLFWNLSTLLLLAR